MSCPSSRRQRQLPRSRPGVFIRASLPRPSRSCAGTTASRAGDDHASSARLHAGSAGSRPVRARVLGREGVPPAARGVVVVRPGVDDAVLTVRRGPVRVVRVVVEAELEHVHPGQPELVAQPHHRRGDHPEVLGHDRKPAELGDDGVEQLAPGPWPPDALSGRRGAGRHGPVRDEAAEVVDAGQVDELERAAEALDPPAVAGRAQRRPVVERVAPELALVGERVRRHACDHVVEEELRPGEMVGAALGDVDRQVADDSDAALVRVPPQRAPLALEAHLVGDRALAGERGPLADPERVAGDEVSELVALDRRPRAPPAARASPRTRTRPCTASRTRRAARGAGPATTTALPPRASRRTSARAGRAARPAARWGAAARRSNVVGSSPFRGRSRLGTKPTHAAATDDRTAAPHPDPARRAAGRRGPLCREADAGRAGRGVGDDLPGRARDPRCGGAGAAARGAALAGVPDVPRRQRPLGRPRRARRLRRVGARGHRRGSTASPRGATSSSARSTRARRTSPASSRKGPRSTASSRSRSRRRWSTHAPDRSELATSPTFAVDVDRERARFGSWYELFPRSWGGFAGVTEALPKLAELGFDVVYLPPVHPIGRDEPQGPEQHARGRPGRPRQPVGDRLGGGRPRRGQPGARHARRSSRRWSRAGARSAARSASTSRSSARPTTRGWTSTRSGSTAGPTGR